MAAEMSSGGRVGKTDAALPRGVVRETSTRTGRISTRRSPYGRTFYASPTDRPKTTDNPFGVKVADRFAMHQPLREVLPALTRDFAVYYQKQKDRISADPHAHVELRPQKAFDQDVSRFVTIVTSVTALAAKEPGTPLTLMCDLDETAGREVEESAHIVLPKASSPQEKTMIPGQMEDPRELAAKDKMQRFVLSPGFVHAVNYLYDEFTPSPGIYCGVLTTNLQSVSQHLYPILEEACPGAFDKRLLLSSRNGAADELIPEVTKLTQDRRNVGTLGQAIEAFIHHSPADWQTRLRNRLLTVAVSRSAHHLLDEPITDFDLKLFMNLRMVQNDSAVSDAALRARDLQSQTEPSDGDMLPPADMLHILLEDTKAPQLFPVDHRMHVVTLPPYRLPDDPPRPRFSGRR